MYSNKNKRPVERDGLFFTTVITIDWNEIRKVKPQSNSNNKEKQEIPDYVEFLKGTGNVRYLKKILLDHKVNNQIIVTTFADNSNELLDVHYVYHHVIKRKKSFLLKHISLASFFSEDYFRYISGKYKQTLITFNCNYENQLYINNQNIYFCVNNATKYRIINHKNLYKDKDQMYNVLVIGLPQNKYNVEKNNANLLTGNGQRKLYEDYFTDTNIHCVNLLGIFTCDEIGFGVHLKNVLRNNHSKEAEVHTLQLRLHESFYAPKKEGEDSERLLFQSGATTEPDFMIHTNVDSVQNEKKDEPPMEEVLDIYKNIFPNFNGKQLINLTALPLNQKKASPSTQKNALTDENRSSKYITSDRKKNEYVGTSAQKNYGKDKVGFLELNMDFIGKEIFNIRSEKIKTKASKIQPYKKVDQGIKYKNIDIFRDVYDIRKEWSHKKIIIQGKKVYINKKQNNSDSDISESFFRNQNKEKNLTKAEKDITEQRVYNEEDHALDKSFIDDTSDEFFKNKKVKKIMNFIRENQRSYFKNDPNLFEEKDIHYMLDHYKNTSPTELQNKENGVFDEFVIFLMDYIGKLHLDINIKSKDHLSFLTKKEKPYNKIQNLIIENGLIHHSNIKNLFNFLIGSIIKKGNAPQEKLHYVLSIFSPDSNFIEFDEFSEHTHKYGQSSIHIFFFYLANKIHILIITTKCKL